MTEYIEQREGGYYVAGTRVSLDSLVYAFRLGESPETIQQQFQSLSLEQVYGAIAFYLGHQAEVDTNIREGEEQIKQLVPPLYHLRRIDTALWRDTGSIPVSATMFS